MTTIARDIWYKEVNLWPELCDLFFVPICAQNSLQEFLSGLFYYQKNWKTLKIEHDLDDLEKAIHKQAIKYVEPSNIIKIFKSIFQLW